MSAPDREPPPRYFGDYPNGKYWSAERSSGHVESDEPGDAFAGDTIRFMWDYGVVVPLWTDHGILPHEPEWLRRALGLSDSLIDDLTEWGDAMGHLDANPPLRAEQVYRDLDQQARDLVARLQQETHSRFRVKYEPW